MHPYETISLSTAGYVLAAWLILSHLWMLTKSDQAISFLQTFPRNTMAGRILMAIGMIWFWLLVAPIGTPLEMDLGEFNGAKRILLIAVPAAAYLMITEVKEFLAVRGLGIVSLMAAAPLLAAAFQEPATGKLLIPLYAYGMLTAGLFFVGMPYLMRDGIQFATNSTARFKAFAAGGLLYGIGVLACSILWY
ncbi:hypothetical protein [Rubritalea marina]|uniref:hypothetical protein n=1 Tax=Rubritalea marina TaxID=361055 RepID=UPI000362F7EC|nr:hypothetical protein [Rubritalea marina]